MSASAWAFLAPYWPTSLWLQALVVVGFGCVAGLFLNLASGFLLMRVVSRTKTSVDDRIVQHLRSPLAWSAVIVGVWQGLVLLQPPPPLPFALRGSLLTVIVWLWTYGFVRVVDAVIEATAEAEEHLAFIDKRTVPLLKMLGKLFVYGGGAYFLFLCWDVDLTAWIASAGIAGIAVGFAAKDTLANLFAGVFIIADNPYKVGDVLVLESGDRGRVVHIGARSTRLVTLDDVEIVVPNAVISNAKVKNESRGTGKHLRLSTTVDAAYGSDVDQVRQVLLSVVEDLPQALKTPAPRVMLTTFSPSGLTFLLRVWIEDPLRRDDVVDALNTLIYKRFASAGIEIPHSKHDVYLKDQRAR